jgi:hypothetical protein
MAVYKIQKRRMKMFATKNEECCRIPMGGALCCCEELSHRPEGIVLSPSKGFLLLLEYHNPAFGTF